MKIKITPIEMKKFEQCLEMREKSRNTIQKYFRDIEKLQAFLGERPIEKNELCKFKQQIMSTYKISSVNSIIAAVNTFLEVFGLDELKIKHVKVQRDVFCAEERELEQAELKRLLDAAIEKKDSRLYNIILTIAGTGIRISELKFFTVKAVKLGRVQVSNKGKVRTVAVSSDLKKVLLEYCRTAGIKCGVIFRTKTGKPVHRTNVWQWMKKLCQQAHVDPKKVFPHNLRKLFAKSFYRVTKNIVKLAALLGHKSIETTRIYLLESVKACAKSLNRLGLIPKRRT